MSNRNKALMLMAAALFGAVTASQADEPARPAAAERFVPRSGTSTCTGGRVEIRAETTVCGTDITLRQLCHWNDADDLAMSTVGDLVIDRFEDGDTSREVSADKIRAVLKQAGTNLGVIQFRGSTKCVVTRGAVPAAVHTGPVSETAVVAGATLSPPAAGRAAPAPEPVAVQTLRDQLIENLSQRVNIPVDKLQVSFASKDANTLNMSEPTFHFDIEPRHVHDLGHVFWDVTVTTGRGSHENREKVTITAETSAWQDELVLTRPLASGQLVTDDDLTEKRVIIDTVPNDPVLTRGQAVGQQASHALNVGTVLTGRTIDPQQLARSGDRITVTLSQGSVQMTTAATAMEGGTLGQSIRVRNEENREIYEVTLVGKKQGEVGGSTTPAQSVAAGN